MTRHKCGDDCPTCESAAEDRRYGYEHDLGMSDLEASRYEAWLDRIGEAQ